MINELTLKIKKTNHSRLAETDFANLPFGRVFADHMLVVDYKDGKWQDAEIVPFDHISLSPATAVFHYGQAIFEGMKANKDVNTGEMLLFRPLENIKRLNRSAERMAMPTFPENLFLEYLTELIKLDHKWVPDMDDSALYLRPCMIASDGFIGVRPSETYKFFIIVGPTGPYYGKPVKVMIEQEHVRAFPGGTGEAKAAGNYATTLLPAKLAKAKGFDQILWTDGLEHKYIEEIGTMNVFFQIDNTFVTPALSGTILPGITRNSVIQLLRDAGYKVEERKLSVDEVLEAHKKGILQDAFGVGTAATITHIEALSLNDTNYVLPPISERSISLELKKELVGIKTGAIEDRHNWLTRIKTV